MKIFDNTGSANGSGSSDLGFYGNPGDVFFTYNGFEPTEDRVVNITTNDFIGDYENYPDLFIYSETTPQLGGIKRTGYIDNSYIAYPGSSTYEFDDHYLVVGRNISSSTQAMVTKVLKNMDFQEPEFFTIDLDFIFIHLRHIFDGQFIYFYKVSDSSNSSEFTSDFIKYDISTNTYEKINFKSKRIVKSYYDYNISKFIVYEINALNNSDTDTSKNGIFIYDNFEDLKTSADIIIDKFDFNSNGVGGLCEKFRNNVLRKKDENIVYIDEDTKQLKDFNTDALISDIVGEDGTNTNISNFSAIFELYNKIFIRFNDIKDSTPYSAFFCKEDNKNAKYAYCYNLGVVGNYLIFNQVFNQDFSEGSPFGAGVVYTTNSGIRQSLTFSENKSQQILVENINTIKPSSTFYEIPYNYMEDDYSRIVNKKLDELDYLMYNNFNLIEFESNTMVDLNYNGFDAPFIYIPATDIGNGIQTYLIVKK